METDVQRPDPPDVRLTYDDLLRLPDDGLRHELIDGVHYVTPSPNMRHQQLAGRLHFEIELCVRRTRIGKVFFAPFDVLFTTWDVVEPDLLLVTNEQAEILTPNNVQGAPALVIEIMSPGTRSRDRGVKRQLFERGGVREYWLVDPERDTVQIFRRSADGELPRAADLSRVQADVLTSPLLPGFALPLHQLFA